MTAAAHLVGSYIGSKRITSSRKASQPLDLHTGKGATTPVSLFGERLDVDRLTACARRACSDPGQQPSTRLGQLHAPGLPHSEDLVGGNKGWHLRSRKRRAAKPPGKMDDRGRAGYSDLRNLLGVSPKFVLPDPLHSPSQIFFNQTVGVTARD